MSGQVDSVSLQKEVQMAGDLTYSWAATFGAVNYTIDIENQTTSEKYSQETANTTVTFYNIPSGTYDITVTAKMTDGSTSIVIEDQSVL